MQHIKNLATAFVILFAVASCKKESTATPAPVPVAEKRIVQEANMTTGDITKYTYNAQGTVIKMESVTNSWHIEYLPSMIKVTRKRITGDVLLGTSEYLTDASGRMISSVSKTPNGTITYNYEYEYDGAGYMVRLKEIYASGECMKML